MRHFLLILAVALAAGGLLPAQSSASFQLDEHQLNAGGHPADGVTLSSASFHMSIDSLGDPLVGRGLASASFGMDGSFLSAYPPATEVMELDFLDDDTLAWSPSGSPASYNLYREDSGTFPGGYGSCHQQGLALPTTDDASAPPPGETFFYLVTLENLLGEEGTKGFTSAGAVRGGTTCP